MKYALLITIVLNVLLFGESFPAALLENPAVGDTEVKSETFGDEMNETEDNKLSSTYPTIDEEVKTKKILPLELLNPPLQTEQGKALLQLNEEKISSQTLNISQNGTLINETSNTKETTIKSNVPPSINVLSPTPPPPPPRPPAIADSSVTKLVSLATTQINNVPTTTNTTEKKMENNKSNNEQISLTTDPPPPLPPSSLPSSSSSSSSSSPIVVIELKPTINYEKSTQDINLEKKVINPSVPKEEEEEKKAENENEFLVPLPEGGDKVPKEQFGRGEIKEQNKEETAEEEMQDAIETNLTEDYSDRKLDGNSSGLPKQESTLNEIEETNMLEAKIAEEEKSSSSSKNGVPPSLKFPEQEDSHFFAYFVTGIIVFILGYLIVHNKQKILAIIVEGRTSRRRRTSHSYKKLNNEKNSPLF